jgi:phosphoglycolate phosphatase-like HAD superfamily hydrolase
MEDVWHRYLSGLKLEFEQVKATVYPGVRQLIDRIGAADEAVLGLLTGNIAEGARLKLTAAGIDFDRFRISAFGSDHHDRRELPAIATQRAEETLGRRFAGKEIVIIGDTPYDISCGEHLGVRTIGVSTGTYTYDQLAACNPDYLFEDLADVDAVWAAIFD